MIRNKKVKDLEMELDNGIIAVASDLHVPFQDNDAVNAFIEYCKDIQPHSIVLNGDVVDMYMLSRFAKGEGRNPMAEIEEAKDILYSLRKACPKSLIFYVIGNHEQRLEKTILAKAPELASLIEDVFSIFKVEDIGIEGCGSLTVNNSFVFKHGTLLGNKSGLSAIKEMENSYMSGASGHTHRLAKYIARKAGRKFVWLETGCLCSMEPEYMLNPNWQQGFGMIQFSNGKVKRAEVIEIENGEVL
jgi:predicted phosphodiesterase